MILQGLNASRGRMDMKVDTSKIRWTDISTVQNLTEDEADKIAATERLVGQGALIDSGIGRLYKRTGKMDIAWSNEQISRRRAGSRLSCQIQDHAGASRTGATTAGTTGLVQGSRPAATGTAIPNRGENT